MKTLKTEIFDNSNTSMDVKEKEIENNGNTCSNNLSCLVCGDTATGRHYGSVACNGCKGFFRRTIRRSYHYTCRFNGSCLIDKHNRAVCRACRYARCIKFGMKVDAVQNERDLIGKRARTFSSTVAQPSSPSPTHQPQQQQQIAASSTQGGGAGGFLPSSPSGGCPTASLHAPAGTSDDTSNVPPMFVSSTTLGKMAKNRRVSGGSGCNMGGNAASSSSASRQQYEFRKRSMNDPSERDDEDNGSAADPWQSSRAILELLLKSEEKIRRMRDSVIREAGKLEYSMKYEPPRIIANGRRATVNDIFHSLHSQLLLVIEWAKSLRPFAELPSEDQTALLKNFASQHIVLSVAYRSINACDSLKLLNDSCIPRNNDGDVGDSDDFYKKDCERVMDTLVAPMRFMQIDEVEFVTLKACILFNPVARGLSNQNVMKVLTTRRKLFGALEHYVHQKTDQPHRVGDLTFFVLSPLQSLAKSVSEDILVTKLSGVARIDQLMEELILEESEPKDNNRLMHLNKSLSTSTDYSDDYTNKQQQLPSSAPAGGGGFLTKGVGNCGRILQCEAVGGGVSISAPDANNHYDGSNHAAFRTRVGSATDSTNSDNNNDVLSSSSISRFGLGGGGGNEIGSGFMAPSNLSPIHDFEMYSTLSSYVLGGPLQGPITSPSNDVLLSSSSAVSEPASSPSPSHFSTSTVPTANNQMVPPSPVLTTMAGSTVIGGSGPPSMMFSSPGAPTNMARSIGGGLSGEPIGAGSMEFSSTASCRTLMDDGDGRVSLATSNNNVVVCRADVNGGGGAEMDVGVAGMMRDGRGLSMNGGGCADGTPPSEVGGVVTIITLGASPPPQLQQRSSNMFWPSQQQVTPFDQPAEA